MYSHDCCGGAPKYSHSCCEPQAPYLVAVPYYYPVTWYPPYAPAANCCSEIVAPTRVPQEIDADPTSLSKEFVVGGDEEVELVLEYLPIEGAVSPELTVECAGPSGTTSVHEAAIPAGFHVKDDFAIIAPGTKLKLTVKDCFARLRWSETITY